jgi:spore maturation protein CgeB
MKIIFYGLTITSSSGNRHATTYRSLCRALARRGHRVEFVEKDLERHRSHRDLPTPEFCKVHLYDQWNSGILHLGKDADVIVVGSYFPDAILATQALLQVGYGPILFYDIDTPVTLAELMSRGKTDYLDAALIPSYDAYLSSTGGPALQILADSFGSPHPLGFYCSVDPSLHKRTELQLSYRCDLSYLGSYAPDRQRKLMHYLNGAARMMPLASFLVAGPQYPANIPWRPNVRRLDHVAPPQHPGFYSSSRFTLNLTGSDMVAAGYSPSVRLFEASACGAAILSDSWAGLEEFFTPGSEILLPRDEYDVVRMMRETSDLEVERIGRAARERVLERHTADHRAIEFEAIVGAGRAVQDKRASVNAVAMGAQAVH